MSKISDFVQLLQTVLQNNGFTTYNSVIVPVNNQDTVVFISATNFTVGLSLPAGKIYTKEGNVVLTLSFPMQAGEALTNIDVIHIYNTVDEIVDLLLNSEVKKYINRDSIMINYLANISPAFSKNRVLSNISINIIL